MFVIYYKDQAKTCRGKKRISMGYYDTAEEAALVVARTPEGKAAAAAGVSMTAEEAIAQAEAEGLTLMRSVASNSGFWNVRFSEPTAEEPRPYHRLGHFGGKPYKAKVALGGKLIELGSFVTVEEGTPRRGSNPGLAESPNLRLTRLSPPPHRWNSGARRGAQGQWYPGVAGGREDCWKRDLEASAQGPRQGPLLGRWVAKEANMEKRRWWAGEGPARQSRRPGAEEEEGEARCRVGRRRRRRRGRVQRRR